MRQELGQDEDGVERCAQLVRHVGQEFGFVLAGDLEFPGLELELLLGSQKLLVLFANGALLIFEFLSPLAELVVDGAQFGLLILHPAFGFLQGAGLLGQFLVGDLQLFLLGLQFGLGFLEHLGLLFQFFVGHTQHLLLLLGLPQQVGDHAARGGHVEENGRALHDLGDELSVQSGKGGFPTKEKGAEQFFAHEDRRGQEVGGDEFSGAVMKCRCVLVNVGEGENLALQRGLTDQSLAHAQPCELAAAVGEGVGGGQHQLAVVVQKKESKLAVQMFAQESDEEFGQLLRAVLSAQGVVQAGLALAQPVHLAQVAGHAVQGLGQHAQFVVLAQIQTGFEVPGGDGFREVHALLQRMADAAGQSIGSGGDHDDQHRAGNADDQQKGPDGTEHFALVDLGDENPVGAQDVEGVEGHEHGRARTVRVGAAAAVEALGHGVVPIGGGAA